MIKSFTNTGITLNEDAIYICNDFGFVLDGATGLLKENVSPIASDATWFACTLRDYFIEELKNTNLSLQDIVKNAIIYANNLYDSFDGAEKVISRPSSGLAMFRIVGNKLEYLSLGDCALIIKTKEDSIIHIKPQELSALDDINIKKMVSLAKENNIDVVDARPLINESLVKTRLTQNTPEGYYIVSNDTKAVDHALCGVIDIDKVSQIVALSDGFSQIYDTFNILTMEELVDQLNKNKPIEEIHKMLLTEQLKDNRCNNFPRFKLKDDASIIYMKL